MGSLLRVALGHPTGLDEWNAKCRAGRQARTNPAKAAIHPPPCTRT